MTWCKFVFFMQFSNISFLLKRKLRKTYKKICSSCIALCPWLTELLPVSYPYLLSICACRTAMCENAGIKKDNGQWSLYIHIQEVSWCSNTLLIKLLTVGRKINIYQCLDLILSLSLCSSINRFLKTVFINLFK